MSMAVLERRLQLLIDHERYQRLELQARAQGRTVAAVVRDAISQHLDNDRIERAAAASRFLATPVPDGPEPEWTGIKRDLDTDLLRGIDSAL
ncbi:MAG: hypothetical protein LBK59_07200 [Bifidobacteriaceae bacterium]|jgi:hypothetical protein|nr:hypothetical protein [Bifidobacteriaceae bacterium]